MNTDQILDLSFTPDSDKSEVETIDLWKFLLLYILSFGLYGVWWMYITWRFFREKDSTDIMPVWRAIFSIFFTYSLFDNILDFAKERSTAVSEYSAGLLAALFIILNFSSRLPDPFWIMVLFAGWCFIKPLKTFDHAIANSDRYQREKDRAVTIGQMIIFIAGGLVWAFIFVGLLLPDEPGYW